MTVGDIITDMIEKHLDNYVHISEVEKVAFEMQVDRIRENRLKNKQRKE